MKISDQSNKKPVSKMYNPVMLKMEKIKSLSVMNSIREDFNECII